MEGTKNALVTGATSGLGFETAAQLAIRGYSQVVVSGRTSDKIAAAIGRLEKQTARDVFEPLVVDLDDLATVEEAASKLVDSGHRFDTLILNAGLAPRSEPAFAQDGLETTVTSSLVGHHVLTTRLLDAGLVNEDARIVIAGSEAARGDVPTFKPVDLRQMASEHFGGDLEAAIEAQMRMQSPAEYKPSDVYATVKVFVAWWATALAERLPAGTTVNAVSPGSTPDTNAIHNAPFYMRYIMVPIFKLIPGMSHSVADGASRYLEVADYGPEITGAFFASRPKKMTGPLARMEYDHIADRNGQQALWSVLAKVTGGVTYKAA